MKQITVMIAGLLFVSCHQQKANLADEEKKIAQVWEDWPKKVLTGKPDSIAFYFSEDVIVMVQGFPAVKGKAEMVKVYTSAPTNFELDIKWASHPNIIQFSKDGDMAYSLDQNEASVPDSTGRIHKVYSQALHVWKKDGEGKWKVSALMIYPIK
ncbi:DUF4440 domain-containing protein [Agriterribacter sp.]|uniref:YybH family protein n=1 Tax=Agriterribacter sp. TaxID=2821509 RepID=UPI002C93958D|nr:DUF4440 domain-containing protein [Agriterribacter sp.]HRP57961.1 DUF4440 domain-containing protein [Agriterribacter sp.]